MRDDGVDQYHTPNFVLTSDGIPLDRERLLAHVRPASRRVESVSVTVHEALRVGDRVAALYLLTALMRRGQTITTEISMFGELAPDGRLKRTQQVTRDVSATGE